MSKAELLVLSKSDAAEKERLEQIVDEGKASFIAVGMALAQIKRNPDWYLPQSFESYAEERFGFKAAHVCRLRKAALIAESLWGEVSPGKLLISEPEKTIRPLAKLLDKRNQDDVAPEQRDRIEAAWARAGKLAEDEGRTVAGRHVKAAVDEVLGVKPKEKASHPDAGLSLDVLDRLFEANDDEFLSEYMGLRKKVREWQSAIDAVIKRAKGLGAVGRVATAEVAE